MARSLPRGVQRTFNEIPVSWRRILAENRRSPLLELTGVSSYYGPVRALEDVSLVVYPGEIVTLIGANGAGKSTLLMTLFGIPRAARGSISFADADITHLPTHAIAPLGLALVPEGRRIFPGMTVSENMELGKVALGKRGRVANTDYLFDLFPILKERRQQKAGTLSGGEQQMLAIARALMGQPRLLLLDEPSLGLAPMVVKKIFALIRSIVQSGTTVFLVEQNANQALQLADRGYVLVNGLMRLTGTGQELLTNPEVRQAYLGKVTSQG
ncbi:MAG: ABC transporter ATP-binding protein [Magnetococcales bacterium]|nr:ABC transporter ATP-binding protein [Magnetococcales bacterium]